MMNPNEALFRITMCNTFIKTKGARDGKGFRRIIQIKPSTLVVQHYNLNTVTGMLDLLPYSSEVMLDKVTHQFTFDGADAEKELRPAGLQRISIEEDFEVKREEMSHEVKVVQFLTMRGTPTNRYRLVKLKKKK